MGILKLMHMKEAKGRNKAQRLKNAINYIFNPIKTEQLIFTGGLHCPSISADAAYEKMVRTKQLLGKTDGRQGYHFILSFSPKEKVSPQLCLQITQEVVRELLDPYESVYAVHTDQAHMHAHIVFNSVSFQTGLKYHYAKGDWERQMMPVINRICREHGLKELSLRDEIDKEKNQGQNLSHSEMDARKKGKYTELQHIQSDLDTLVGKVYSYEELLNELRKMGYTIRPGAETAVHLSLIPPGSTRTKFMRTDKLGLKYMPEGLKTRIAEAVSTRNNEKPDSELDTSEKAGTVNVDQQQPDEFLTGETAQKSFNKNMNKHSYSLKRTAVMIKKQHIPFKKNYIKPMTYFGKCYLKYYLYFTKLQKKPEAVSWQDSEDVKRVQKMLDEIAYIRSHDIKGEQQLARISDRLKKEIRIPGTRKQLKCIERIKAYAPAVRNFISEKTYTQGKNR